MMINNGVQIVSLTEKISLMVKETVEDFIIETIEPYCSELAEIKISKEELKNVILKNYDTPKADVLNEIRLKMKESRDVQNVPYDVDYYSYVDGIDKCLDIIDEYRKEQE